MTDNKIEKIEEEIVSVFFKYGYLLKHTFNDNGTAINHYVDAKGNKIINTFEAVDGVLCGNCQTVMRELEPDDVGYGSAKYVCDICGEVED